MIIVQGAAKAKIVGFSAITLFSVQIASMGKQRSAGEERFMMI
jgi:hypothetical protein